MKEQLVLAFQYLLVTPLMLVVWQWLFSIFATDGNPVTAWIVYAFVAVAVVWWTAHRMSKGASGPIW